MLAAQHTVLSAHHAVHNTIFIQEQELVPFDNHTIDGAHFLLRPLQDFKCLLHLTASWLAEPCSVSKSNHRPHQTHHMLHQRLGSGRVQTTQAAQQWTPCPLRWQPACINNVGGAHYDVRESLKQHARQGCDAHPSTSVCRACTAGNERPSQLRVASSTP